MKPVLRIQPAYGKVYPDFTSARDAWIAGADFMIVPSPGAPRGTYCSKRDDLSDYVVHMYRDADHSAYVIINQTFDN